MTKDLFSDGVLVYDRYYCNKPHTALLVIKRILLAVLFCVSSMMYILTEFDFPVSLPEMAAVCGISCTVFSVLLVFIKKRWLLPSVLVISGLTVWANIGVLRDKLSYFADACMLLVEGRFLYPRRYLFHFDESLNGYNRYFVEGVVLGTVLMCLLYSLIISLCFSGKIRPVIPALLFITLCVPVVLSERIEFSFWLIPALASLAGAFAIRKNYSAGLAVKHSSFDDYRRKLRTEERSFLKHISKAPLKKRIEMRCNYYSKYFSSGMYCASLAAVCLMIGAVVIPEGGSIDYTEVYAFFAELASDSASGLPATDNDTTSDYFTHSGEQEDLLNIVSPGRGEREMLLVTYSGNRPFYLRGDVGVDFTGRSWTTIVGNEPEQWKNSPLKENYRPCENQIIQALLSASSADEDSSVDGLPLIYWDLVSIDYLCNTDVVFLPPYTSDFSFYENELFEVFGDYAVRVSESAGSHVNSVECYAMIPSYTSNEKNAGDAEGLARIENQFDSSRCTPNDLYNSWFPEMTETDILLKYEEYVNSTYLSIPDNYSQDIDSYIKRCLYDEVQSLKSKRESGMLSEVQYRYQLSAAVAEYLRSNYTYSLDGSNNSREPVLQFLNETKRGHCSLYASAMTLILRELGVPARYCTGFYVEAPEGSNSVMLREKNLHAWVEVYVGEYGWVTFDPTSSAAYPDRNSGVLTTEGTGETTEPASLASTEQPLVPTTESQDDSVTNDENSITPATENYTTAEIAEETAQETGEAPGSSVFEHVVPYLPFVLCIIAAAVIILVLLLRVKSLKRSAQAVLERLSLDSSSSREIYLLMLSLLEFYGLRPGRGEFAENFWKRIDARFGTSLSEHTGLLEALEFGAYETNDEEHEIIFAELSRIITSVSPFGFPWKIKVMKLIISQGNKK